jgi:hypothetical protein
MAIIMISAMMIMRLTSFKIANMSIMILMQMVGSLFGFSYLLIEANIV